MLGLAEGFAAAGHPACIIDRPGYGWSEPGYWMQDPVDVVKSINQALTKYPIANPIVLVGWGEGGVWAQMYMQAADYSRVIGVVLLDTYPNEEILQTFALNRTTTLQNLRQLRSASTTSTSPSVHFDAALERSASNLFSAWRAVSPLALHRARNSAWPGFQPQSALNMHRAMFRNNLYYQAKYFEYAGTGAALYRGLLSYVGSDTDAVLVYHHWPLRWPAFRQESGAAFSNASLKRRDGAPTAPASSAKIPVLVVASAKQFNSDCGVQGIGDAEQCTVWQAFAWFYYRQQIEYQQTLSQNAALLLCQGRVAEDNTECDVGFVWRRPGWLAQAIVSQLISQPAGTSSVASATSAEETNSAASSETSLESQTDSVASTQSTPSESSVESQFSASFATQSAFAETSITF
ncbi:hypothetical protein GGI05_005227 [Coemansia sp. RSA 2603]|nr:hypothetical protein GGI05_005227 [Coemansia sp. RSA 2603]